MRITLQIDIETEDIARLQQYVGDPPAMLIEVPLDGWKIWGRFVGAKEAYILTEAETPDA